MQGTMKINILDLIDFEEVNKLLEGFNQSTGFVTAILDLDGNVLSKSGWRQICTEFHRINPESTKNCNISDTVLANHLGSDEKYHFYQCLNGLVDVAVPIVIKGEHVANLFSGQFFFEVPNRTFFEKQAERLGFDKAAYLEACDNVPIVSKEQVKVAMDFLLNMTQIISEISFQRMEQEQLNEALSKSEERYRSTLDSMLEGCQLIGFDWKYLYLNRTAEIHNKRPNSELIGHRYMDMWPGIEETSVFKSMQEVLEKRTSTHFENEFTFPDGTVGVFDLSIQAVPEGLFILSIDITERKRKEKLLLESEFRFDKLYTNGPFGMVMVDEHFQFIRANPMFCSILQYSESELKHLTFKDITFPDDLERNVENVRKLINKEMAVYKTEKRYVRKNGEVFWVSLTVTANFDTDGAFLYNLAIIEEITNRKQAEQEVIRLSERISTATRASQMGIWDWDIQNNVLAWDDQMYALYGLKREDFSGAYDAWLKGLHPDDRASSQLETDLALSGEKEYDTQFRLIWPDGSVHWIKARGEVFRDEAGVPNRMVGINYDVTKQILVENALHESENRFRKAFTINPDAITITRLSDGLYTSVNDGFNQIFGYAPDEVVGKTSLEINIWHQSKDRQKFVEELRTKGVVENFEARLCTKNGKVIDTLVSASIIELDGSNHVLSTTKDISDLKKIQELLLRSEEEVRKMNETLELRVVERTAQLDAANRELEAFSYSVSHDLRAPLRHINGYVDLLNERFQENLPDKAQHYLTTISTAAKQMGTLIDDLLQFSRTGRQEMRRSKFNMGTLLAEVLEKMKPDTKHRNITWSIQELPDVTGDYAMLKQVWANLLDNAVKYTKLQDSPEITIQTYEEAGNVIFSVRDNGVGFDMKYAGKLFGVFQRLHSQAEFEGTGIGLANVQRILQKHNGNVWAEAEYHKGATFYFSLPKK